MGDSGVGRVFECGRGVTEVQVGDLVAMADRLYSEINRVTEFNWKISPELNLFAKGALCAYRVRCRNPSGQVIP